MLALSPSIVGRIPLAAFQSSTKIEALCEEVHRMRMRDSSGVTKYCHILIITIWGKICQEI